MIRISISIGMNVTAASVPDMRYPAPGRAGPVPADGRDMNEGRNDA